MNETKELQRPNECFGETQEIRVSQEFTIKRLTFRNIFFSFLNAFNIERGVVFTLKQLFLNPGLLARDYITTGRYRYTPPFRLLLITTALVLFIIERSSTADQFQAGFFSEVGSPETAEKVFAILSEYRNIWFWLYIPLVSLFTWPIFRKQGFNYAENLVLHTFTYCISNLLGLLIALDHWVPSNLVWGINFLGTAFFYVYSYKVFFNRKWAGATFEMLGLYFVTSIIYTIVVIAVVFLILVIQSGKL